jgi:hypothetical protein
VVTRAQLLGLGFSPHAIKHRLKKGRLHPVGQGIYALGRPQLTQHGLWMAAVLGCGPEAALSHASAAALWELQLERGGAIEVSVRPQGCPRRPGIRVHRRKSLSPDDRTRREGIRSPLPSAPWSTWPIASQSTPWRLLSTRRTSAASVIPRPSGRPSRGCAAGREWPPCAVRSTAAPSPSPTQRSSASFRSSVRPASRRPRPAPMSTASGWTSTGRSLGWSWRRTACAITALRPSRAETASADQAHAAAGLTALRFTHAQVRFDPGHVGATLTAVRQQLQVVSSGE